jgi:hypothetical protein
MKKLVLCLALIAGLSKGQQVGINTPQPTAMLDVNGNGRIRKVPTGLVTDSILVVNNGFIRKIAISSLNLNNQGTCPNLIRNQSNPWYLLFSSTGSIPNPANPLVINNLNFVNAGNWIQGNTYYYSWTNVSGQPLTIVNNFTVNFGSLQCTYNH